MASIRKRPNGKWQAAIYVGRDANGKQMFRYVTRDTYKECKAAAREIEQEVEEGKLVNIRNMRVIAWIKEWLDANEYSYSPATISLYNNYLKNHYQPYFNNLKLDQLTEIHITKFRNYLLGKMKPSSARRCFSALKKMLADALKDKSPAKGVKAPQPNDPDVEAPTPEDFAKIYSIVKGSYYELPTLIAGWMGYRRGEVLALRINDLDFETNRIRVDEAWTKTKDGTYVIKAPKSKNGYRNEVAPGVLMEKLKEHVKKLRSGKVVPLRDDTTLLFNMRPDTFSTCFRRFLMRRNGPDYSFHELRHFHATWMFENDFPDLYAAKRMGQTLQVLKETYQHLGLKRETELDEKVAEIENTILHQIESIEKPLIQNER